MTAAAPPVPPVPPAPAHLPAPAPAAPPAPRRGLALSRNRLARYLAAAGGLVALLLFYLPWVSASLSGIGTVSLSGAELAGGVARSRVNQIAIEASRAGAAAPAGATAAAGGAGSSALPTRVPTVAPGGAAGGSTLPTRVPTVAPGGSVPGASSGFGSSSGVAQPGAPAGAPGGAPAAQALPAAPPAPDVLPQTLLYLIPLAGLGVAAFSVIWDRLTDTRDRAAGRVWTLLLAYGGTLFSGLVLYRVATALPDNVLVGQGVGSVTAPAPALWGVFLGFLFSAVCLTVAWLSPAPPPPDPYWRARAPV